MSLSKESRAKLPGALEEACDVSLFDVTRESKRLLLSDVCKGTFDKEVMVSVVKVSSRVWQSGWAV